MTEPPPPETRIEYLTWTEYRARLQADPIVFLPVGALEQHGPHLPLATDALFAEAIAGRLAAALDGLVMPRLTYGCRSQARSGGGQTFPGTTSLDGTTLMHTVMDIIRELARHGVTRLAVIDGHFENKGFLTEGIELALRELHLQGKDMRILRCEYWDYTPQTVLDAVFDGDFPGVDLEHAALIETSMMLALHPQRVRDEHIPDDALARFPGHDHYPQDGRGVPDTGVLAPAGAASREKGEMLIDATVEAMTGAFREAFSPASGD